jgi:hypothetical protein
MCTIKIIIEYGMNDTIIDTKITATVFKKSGPIMNKVFIKRITAKQEIYNSM